MHRLDDSTLAYIHTSLNYTDEQKEVIRNCSSRDPCGLLMSTILKEEDKLMMTTKEGISKQLDNFTQNVGLIYVLRFKDKDMEIQQIAVKLGSI